MKKIIVPGLAAGLLMLLVSLLLTPILYLVFPGLPAEYQTPGLFRPWSDPLMSLIFVHPILLGLILAWVWDQVKSAVGNGLKFGVGVWLIASVPGMFISYSSFYLSLAMITSWTLLALVQLIFAGMVYARLNK